MITNILELNPEYVYIRIPEEYLCVYHIIMQLMSEFGEDMIMDCNAHCKNKNINIIKCFNMFNAAVSAHKLNKKSLADTIIKYIKAELNKIYKLIDNKIIFELDNAGNFISNIDCGKNIILQEFPLVVNCDINIEKIYDMYKNTSITIDNFTAYKGNMPINIDKITVNGIELKNYIYNEIISNDKIYDIYIHGENSIGYIRKTVEFCHPMIIGYINQTIVKDNIFVNLGRYKYNDNKKDIYVDINNDDNNNYLFICLPFECYSIKSGDIELLDDFIYTEYIYDNIKYNCYRLKYKSNINNFNFVINKIK